MLRILLALMLISTPSWAVVQWRNGDGSNTILGTSNASDIDTNTFNNVVSPLDSLLAGYRKGMALIYDSASQITVSSGEITVSNADGSIRLFLRNTSNTTVTWSDIDTGAEASATTYYIYAIAASASSTSATFKISANSTSPSGVTYYKKIGSFYNNSSSDIDRTKIYTEASGAVPADASGLKMIQAFYDYGSSASSFTSKTGGALIAVGDVSVTGSSSTAITNLPFTSATTFICQVTYSSSTAVSENPICVKDSGSQITIYNNQSTRNIQWVAIGY